MILSTANFVKARVLRVNFVDCGLEVSKLISLSKHSSQVFVKYHTPITPIVVDDPGKKEW